MEKVAGQLPVLLRLISSSVALANHAGVIIRDVMSRGELGIVEKGVNDPQTEADRRAQQCIVGNLSACFPLISIIGEEDLSRQVQDTLDPLVNSDSPEILGLACPESLASIKEDELTVWVDPLDGTSEYTQGNLDHVTVLIGVSHGDRAVGGVIHQPYYNYDKDPLTTGRTLWGIPGLGTGGFSPQPPPPGLVVATTRSHMTPLVQQSIDAIKPDQVLKIGGAGYKVLMLMEGSASAYVFASAGCNKWDTCAPEAILRAVGGQLTDIHGIPYPYGAGASAANRRGVLATARTADHQPLVDAIPAAVKEQLV